jgi:hypothetical protein
MTQSASLGKTIRHRKKALRLGTDAGCDQCDESDHRVLQGVEPVLCAECRLARAGKPTTERHHPAGRHNDAFTAPLPANPHAAFSDAQIDWPPETLRNPEHDFLRILAAWLRFFADTFRYLSEQASLWATTLERYSLHLTGTLGPQWWTGIEEGA